MAEAHLIWAETLAAAADLSAKQYHFVRYSAANAINQASDAQGSGLCGVLQNKPVSGAFGTVGMLGISKVVVGGVVTAGDIITTNGSGRAATVRSGDMAAGRALTTSGADGDVISAVIWPPVKWFGAP
jgi:hypothetical protein